MMNSNTTKTMRLPPRRLMTSPRPNNKRKEREGLDYDDDDDDEAHQLPLTAKVPKPTPTPTLHSKQLLAGYLALEFLTKGTLFGQTWDNPDPAAANANAMASSSSSSFSSSPLSTEPQEKRQAEAELHHPKKNYQSYVEVANLLKHNGPHLQGIVNPTQLARFLNL